MTHKQEIEHIYSMSSVCNGHGRKDCGKRRCQREMEYERLRMLADKGKRPPPDVASALYTFAGWLTTRKETLVVGEVHDAAKLSELLEQFCEENNLPEPNPETNRYRHP